jgi:hypothetical protein
MVWFKVDDSLPFHAKVVHAGNAAMGLWVRAGAWSAQQLTDGFIPSHIVTTLGTTAQAKKLVAVQLWVSCEGGYRFHQWNEDGRQPTRADVEKDRAEARDRMRRAREEKRKRSGELQANTSRSSGGVRSTRPDPTRPDPTPTTSRTTSGGDVASGDARDPNGPPQCSKHRGLARADVPDCWACGHLRTEWEAQRSADAVFERPHWCGECDPHSRQRETPLGIIRCRECHPLAEEA